MTLATWDTSLAFLYWGGLALLAIYLVYTLLMFISDRWITGWFKRHPPHIGLTEMQRQQLPAITLLIPACNEESVIQSCVESALHLTYPNIKLLVVNDGSQDQTLPLLLRAYQMTEVSLRTRTRVSPTQASGLYQSAQYPHLYVLDKPNTGKADSLNCALQYVDTKLFALCDADSELEKNALEIMVRPFLEQSAVPTLAVGATIRVKSSQGLMNQFQRLEFMRAFFCGRVCWNFFGRIYLISGAIGLYDTQASLLAAGIPVTSQTEDLDFSFRLHAYHHLHHKPYRMIFLPNPVCATAVPKTFRSLFRQRFRWHRGLAEILWSYRGIFLNPNYGLFGSVIYPYLLVIELLSSALEWALILVTLAALGQQVLSWNWVLAWAGISFLWAFLVNAYMLSMVRRHFPDEITKKEAIHLLWIGCLENLGYHQMVSLFRVLALNPFLKRDDSSWRYLKSHARGGEP